MAHLYIDKQRNGFILFLAKDLSVPAYSGCSWAILRYDSPLRRRGKKPGLKPLPHDLKRKRITLTLAPKYHKQVAAHKSPGMFVEHCVSLARCITREQYSRLVEIHLTTGVTVDKLVHQAIKEEA